MCNKHLFAERLSPCGSTVMSTVIIRPYMLLKSVDRFFTKQRKVVGLALTF